MHTLFRLLLPLALLLASCGGSDGPSKPDPTARLIPFQGNVFVTQTEGNLYSEAPAVIDTYSGKLLSWNRSATVLSLYFRTSGKGTLHLACDATPRAAATTGFTFSCNGRDNQVDVEKAGYHDIGDFEVAVPGYVRVDIRGSSSPAGAAFARIDRFYVSGPAIAGELCYTPEDGVDDCYWYRRGPSVHLMYDFPQGDAEWFYNEAVVPEGYDPPATYYMLTGFREGYMGIQTHTQGPNTVLFSVWSPYQTDNPGSIPEDMRVLTLRKGEGVTAQDFGGEGSGGQSFMDSDWKPGQTLGTLVHVRPNGDNTTDYTGYFRDGSGRWHLLASFRRPATDTWYQGAYSFLECFDPNTSIRVREARFSNQWVRLKDGSWHEVTSAKFSCDNTGRKGMRGDLYGAVEGKAFLLRNCGFFDEKTEYGTPLQRNGGSTPPDIDFNALEKL